MNWFDVFSDEGERLVQEKVVTTVIFKNLLKNCACENDKKYINQFDTFYTNLIEKKIIQQGNNFFFFNQSDYFVEKKHQELESLLKTFDFEDCTKKQILEFYKSETGMIMNVVNKYGGRKTRKKRSWSRKKSKLLHQKTKS